MIYRSKGRYWAFFGRLAAIFLLQPHSSASSNTGYFCKKLVKPYLKAVNDACITCWLVLYYFSYAQGWIYDDEITITE
jgi:hypothetical protein